MEAIQFESKLISNSSSITTVILGSFLLAISAQLTLPLQPVPITLQSFVALLVGILFGPKMGSKIILLYLCEGGCGLPVFANFSWGPQVLFGPTGGYLFGFIPATLLVGYLLQSGWVRHRITTCLAAIFGTVLLFIPGYLVLANFIGFHNAYLLGVAPFYGVEAFKLVIFTIITPFFWKPKTANYDYI